VKTPLARSLARSIVLALVSVSALAPSLAANPLHPKKKVEAPPPPPTLPQPVPVASGWQLQDVAKVQQPGAVIASDSFKPAGWYAATVPGTVLTTLVNNKVYPEPLYGENNRPEVIPESLNKTSYWYRTELDVPKNYGGKRIWLNFDGINYSSTIWVNGTQIGTTRGAFIRGAFDITANVAAGKKAILAVLVAPQPHPGVPHEHTLRSGMGGNGGETAIDGPTFLSTIGWDWIPAIRDRDTGIWRKVYLSATGPVVVKDPLVTTDLPLPRTDSADIGVQATVQNATDQAVTGELDGVISGVGGDIKFSQPVTLAAHATQLVSFDSKTTQVLHVDHPLLWWPNGYGAQNLYKLHLAFVANKQPSSEQDVNFGIRKIAYSVPGTDTLTISVNGVPIFIRGGDWGLDEALKRIPRERLEAEIRMHQLANVNLIRNWVGQSTGEDFYDLCDKYGILIWDEFFQPNPSDGPNPTDLETYVANVRDKILHFRNHPAIMLWCARNEGFPPPEIDEALRKLMAELEPTRRYQPSSTDGAGVRSGGPYFWRTPRDYYIVTDDYFKTETGSVSIPTLESVHGMLAKKDWEMITDAWAEHDLARGASNGDKYPGQLAARYGTVTNLADFVRKGQLMNYEAYRSMYEGRNAQMFHPTTAIITWMSSPAQPSFVWQLYHYDLEANSSLFAVKKAGEMRHIQLNESTGDLEVINNLPDALAGAQAHATIYDLDGNVTATHDFKVEAPASAVTNLGPADYPAAISAVHFVKLDLVDAEGKPLSTNFYWRGLPERPDDLTGLNKLPMVTLEAKVERSVGNGRQVVTVTLHNPTKSIALMTHLQLRDAKTNDRILPAFASDNYVSLIPDETRIITIEAAGTTLNDPGAQVVVDGWNVSVAPASANGVTIAPNVDAQPDHSPNTGLPFQTTGLR
jgi:hypothetical protein